jgi:hypothetical protein
MKKLEQLEIIQKTFIWYENVYCEYSLYLFSKQNKFRKVYIYLKLGVIRFIRVKTFLNTLL